MYSKSIYFIVLGLALQIAFVFIFGFAIADGIAKSLINNGTDVTRADVLTTMVGNITLISGLSIGYMAFSFDLISLKATKQFKQISLANITRAKYLITLLLVNITFLLITVLIQAILLITIFHIHLTAEVILSLTIMPVIYTIIGFTTALVTTGICDSQKVMTVLVMLGFYIMMFTSGTFMYWEPFSIYAKTIPMITPMGCLLQLMSFSFAPEHSFTEIWWALPIFIVEMTALIYGAYKLFKWN
jgi:ABC-2 type transport system permease protein